MNIIAQETIVYQSPSPLDVFCFSPGVTKLPCGRLVATFDLGGPGVANLPGPKSKVGDFDCGNQGKVMISDDHGVTWQHVADLPMLHARPLVAGNALYVIGHGGALSIAVSHDRGETWSAVVELDTSAHWHQAPCAVDYRHGKVYLTMEQRLPNTTWPGTAPVLMSATCTDDLTCRDSWTFSNPLRFEDVVSLPTPNGVPFWPTGFLTPEEPDQRFCGDPGFLESHVLRIYDPNHTLYDPLDRTVMIWMRAHTGLTNIAAVAKGVEGDDGSLTLQPITTPGGAPLAYVNCPGGHMKFHILYDKTTQLYWMASSQSTDSMTRPECLGTERFGMPDSERSRLVLHFSKNLFDWCFAGVIAIGETPRCSRHYASMIIDGSDLLVFSRSGDQRAKSAHNGNLLTLHRIKDFRQLIY